MAIETAGLEDITMQFLSCRKAWLWYSRTWCMHFQGREVWYQMYYLIETEYHLFQNVSI